jgi:hypothetical protein
MDGNRVRPVVAPALLPLRPRVASKRQSNHVKKQYYGVLSSQIDLAKKEAAPS